MMNIQPENKAVVRLISIGKQKTETVNAYLIKNSKAGVDREKGQSHM